MPKQKSTPEGKKGVIYVSLYKGESVSSLSQQIENCLQMEPASQQERIEIYGDIESPDVSVSDINLIYPTHACTITGVTPHNGKWSGFHLLATKKKQA